ncbi:MAG TPA: glycoside hydrolase family 28 protein [Opitutaceae bacterium]|nr:glycoside hydrolase family 28 protein [Opitutaceae bacterium]
MIFCDGKAVGKTAKTHFTLRNLAPSTKYAVAVEVANASAESSASATQPFEITTAAKETTLSIDAYGAKGDGQTLNTKAIQAAIDACPKNGVVLVPRGSYLTGALFLKSDMTLQIEEGGSLVGSTEPSDYEPFIKNRFEGWEMETYASLLNAGTLDHAGPPNVQNLSIRGKGRITGGGRALGDAMIKRHGMRSRGRLICLMNCRNVELQGLILENPPCWTLHYIYSDNVTCHDLTIQSTVLNGDGLDPDSSTNSYIFNCSFDTGDDCIAIKSGKNPEGNIINRPTEHVRIFDCTFVKGHGISIGSEMSGGVRDVTVEDCVAGNLMHGMQIKATKDRGNVVEGVVVRDCELQKISILTELNYNNDGAPAPAAPHFRNFVFSNIDLTKADPAKPVIIVNGYSEAGHRTTNLAFENITLPAGAVVRVDQAEDVRFSNVTTVSGEKPKYDVTRSEDIQF